MTIQRFRESKRVRVAVYGDPISDHWIVVNPKRSGEDAPCWKQIVRFALPGGALNVERQMSRLNVEVIHLGRSLRDVSTKTRWWDGSRVVARLDDDRFATQQDAAEDVKVAVARLSKDPPDALIIADYGKGIVTPDAARALTDLARRNQFPVVIDPKDLAPAECGGASVVKANAAWASRFPRFGETDLNFILTNGRGITLLEKQNTVLKEATPLGGRTSSAAINAVGAGDCFAAHLAVAIARGAELPEAMIAADAASRKYVVRPFCNPLFPHEAEGRKIVHEDDVEYVTKVRAAGEKVVAANGCFDVLHPGHVEMLRWASELGQFLVVLVNDDDSVRRLKGHGRPAIPLEHRLFALEALSFVDLVVPFSGDDPREVLRRIDAKVVAKGPDAKGRTILRPEGVEVAFAPEGGWSGHSSDLIGKKGD